MATKSDMCETFSSPDRVLRATYTPMIAGLSLKSASKTTKMLMTGALLVAIAGAFAGCFASSDDTGEDTSMQTNQNSLPFTVRTCPGIACK